MSKAQTPKQGAVKPPLALIAGPTASGKSDMAVQLGLNFMAGGKKAVIVNADSAQVYRDLNVLSARPGDHEMQGVPHRLFGEWDGALACSAADWAMQARQVIAEAHATGAVPILVGGTGLYLRTLLDGIAPVPEIDPDVRKSVRALPVDQAFAALRCEDPARAAKLAPADSSRIFRALEVVRSTGRALAEWQADRIGGIGDAVSLHPLVLLPERKWLYQRCDERFSAMLRHGAIDEVRALLARQLDPALPVMRAIGVREIAAFLRDEISIEECESKGQQATRNYAKRQYTWFGNQFPEEWRLPLERPFILHDHFEILFHS